MYIGKNTFGKDGLIYTQSYVLITNAIIPGLVEIVDFWGYFRKYQ